VNPARVLKVKIQVSITTALSTRQARICDSGFPNAMSPLNDRAPLRILNEIGLDSYEHFNSELVNVRGKDLGFNELE
jgi:hypothetical protein